MSQTSEDLSVIVPTYNHGPYIDQCLASIFKQKTKYKIQVYVLDDRSTDGTSDICRAWEKKFDGRLTYMLSPQNLGSGKKSHYYHRPQIGGRYWAILEGDDAWISEDKVEKQLDVMEADSTLVGTGHGMIIRNADGSEKMDQPTLGKFTYLQQIRNRRLRYHYAHTSTLIWRHIFASTGNYFPPEFIEEHHQGDPVLFGLMTRHGGYVQYLPDLLSLYNHTGQGRYSRLNEEAKKKAYGSVEKRMLRLLPFHQRLSVNLTDIFNRARGAVNRTRRLLGKVRGRFERLYS